MDHPFYVDINATGPRGTIHIEGARVHAADLDGARTFVERVLREQGYQEFDVTPRPFVEPRDEAR